MNFQLQSYCIKVIILSVMYSTNNLHINSIFISETVSTVIMHFLRVLPRGHFWSTGRWNNSLSGAGNDSFTRLSWQTKWLGFQWKTWPSQKGIHTNLSTSASQKGSSRLYFYLHEWRKAYKLLTSEIPCSAVTLNKLCGLVRSKRKIVNYNSGSHYSTLKERQTQVVKVFFK